MQLMPLLPALSILLLSTHSRDLEFELLAALVELHAVQQRSSLDLQIPSSGLTSVHLRILTFLSSAISSAVRGTPS